MSTSQIESTLTGVPTYKGKCTTRGQGCGQRLRCPPGSSLQELLWGHGPANPEER